MATFGPSIGAMTMAPTSTTELSLTKPMAATMAERMTKIICIGERETVSAMSVYNSSLLILVPFLKGCFQTGTSSFSSPSSSSTLGSSIFGTEPSAGMMTIPKSFSCFRRLSRASINFWESWELINIRSMHLSPIVYS